MSEVVITVRGEHEIRIAPERGTARIAVSAEGAQRGPVVEQMAKRAEPIREGLAARTPETGLLEWSSQRVSVWSDRPWNNEGKQLPLVHHASVEFYATFTDFAVLSWWIGDAAEREGVEVRGVDWHLSPETARRTEAEVSAEAVHVAVTRATAYAAALGLGKVAPREIADLGLLSQNESAPHSSAKLMRAVGFASADMAGGQGVDLQPQNLVVSAAVEGRFIAS